MTTQPEALRLADYLTDRNRLDLTCDEAAAELRRLHDEVERLRAALRLIASCQSHHPGDVVDIARNALKETK
jgi:hypothetical protein